MSNFEQRCKEFEVMTGDKRRGDSRRRREGTGMQEDVHS